MKKVVAILTIIFIVSILSIVFSSSEIKDPTMTQIKPEAQWKQLEGKVIYFGHQSVGANILDGVKEVKNGYQLNINDFYIGENRDPISKIYAFRDHIKEAANSGEQIDIAMMKFCYVDFPSSVSMETVFNTYVATMKQLQDEFPNITFVHMTVPLTTEQPGNLKVKGKRIIKKLIGKKVYDTEANMLREGFNSELRTGYTNNVIVKKHIFDIARIQSDNQNYREYEAPALHPVYTYDGGHLNERGRQTMAWYFLNFLSNL